MKIATLEILENANLPSAQARAILKAMAMAMALDQRDETLVKRGEIHALALKLEKVRAEIQGLGTRLMLWMFGRFVAVAGRLFTVLGHSHP